MIDLETLADNLDFDIEDVYVLLELFIENAQASLASIEEAIEAKNLETIANEAHAIKGSAANLMLVDIQDIAREIENAAKERSQINYLSLFELLEEKIEKISEVSQSYA